ncbi:MAG: sigma-70 family RNA polymerase sigma factor [Bacteroidales bacterium]|nr:sigma-70 family RNA polymerase sigma factor [Bacteroidales bacterium]
MQHFKQKLHLTNRNASGKEDDFSSEAGLIKLSIKGDRAAQKAIFDALAPKMMAVCLRYAGDREVAEDVLQDGFVTLFTKLESFSGDGSFEGWARKIFVNTALMSLRKKDALRDSGDLELVTGRASEAASQLQTLGYKELMSLVAELPPVYRTAFNLFAIEGYSHKEIAEALGITEATSRSHVNRARTYLQERIKKM